MDETRNTANEVPNREIEIGEEIADVFHPIFMKTAEQVLELGLRQMRDENESLSTENRRLKDEIRTLIEQARRAGFVGATKDKHP
jgi:predicted component of type VI protein secretion system